MAWLEHRVPPPLVLIGVALLMWLAHGLVPYALFTGDFRLIFGLAFFVAGVICDLLAAMAFRRAQTTVNPLKPETSRVLVRNGLYGSSRNPMYVGQASVLIGWAIYLGGTVALLGPVIFVAYITRFQIVPEERILAQKFGADYRAYCEKVRRWL